MDIEEEKPLEGETDLIGRKLGAVDAAKFQRIDEISSRSEFTPEDGIHLGGDIVAYKVDHTVLLRDLAEAHNASLRVSSEFHDDQVQLVAILIQMKIGNFRPLKECLRREGERYASGGHISIMDLVDWSEEERRGYGKKLLQMIEAIPNEDSSLCWSPPNLAWQALGGDQTGAI